MDINKVSKMSSININLKDKSIKVKKGISLLELAKRAQDEYKYRIIAAKVDNEIKELSYILNKDAIIELIDISDEDGMRIYKRSLYFLLIKAVYDIFPKRKVRIGHSISKGIYCEIVGKEITYKEDIVSIEKRMYELVEKKIEFKKRILDVKDAREILFKSGRHDRLGAIEYREKSYISIYNCDGFEDYFYGYMVPDTGYLKYFKLVEYLNGIIMIYPKTKDPTVIPPFIEQNILFSIFKEFKTWGRILGVENVGALNNIAIKHDIGDLIRISEALHEKKLAQIADMIMASNEKKRIILISGPSSSGKTTFAKRLSTQLKVNGMKPVTISLDDYFKNRENTPIDEKGEYDFEELEAIDIELFNNQLLNLINGAEVEIPIYDFNTGSRKKSGRKLSINNEQILLIEGIHGLNEKLTSKVPKGIKFKIYVSAITSMNIDDHNRIPTTDTRMIRRIVRDYYYRNCNVVDNIKRWSSVRRGEEKNIFPFQEEADIMFNSALIYELGVLKTYAEPLLKEIDKTVPQYSEARRLIEFLSYFVPINSKEIPRNSIIREFIGGSCFY